MKRCARTARAARVVACVAAGVVAGSAGAAFGQGADPKLDPNYDPKHDANAQTPAVQTPAQTPAQTAPAQTPAQSPASGVPHPATVMTVVDPENPVMTAPPPGWQLVRPVFLGGRLYYAVDDAEKYLAQAGWTRPARVFEKEDTGYRFDLILVPPSARGTVVRGAYVGYGTTTVLDTGGVGFGHGSGVVSDRYRHYRHGDNAYTGGFAGPIDGQLSPGYVPAPPERPVVVELTLLEQAGLELAHGDPARAAELFERYLQGDPEDAYVMRSLGVALLAAGREEDAVAMVRLAYVTDPNLAGEPLGDWITGGSARALRELKVDAVRYAQRTESASAWLMVTALMQAEGHNKVALRQLDKAKALGLDEKVELMFRGELTRGP